MTTAETPDAATPEREVRGGLLIALSLASVGAVVTCLSLVLGWYVLPDGTEVSGAGYLQRTDVVLVVTTVAAAFAALVGTVLRGALRKAAFALCTLLACASLVLLLRVLVWLPNQIEELRLAAGGWLAVTGSTAIAAAGFAGAAAPERERIRGATEEPPDPAPSEGEIRRGTLIALALACAGATVACLSLVLVWYRLPDGTEVSGAGYLERTGVVLVGTTVLAAVAALAGVVVRGALRRTAFLLCTLLACVSLLLLLRALVWLPAHIEELRLAAGGWLAVAGSATIAAAGLTGLAPERPQLRRAAGWAPGLLLLSVAIPLFSSLGQSIWRLVQTRDVDLGFWGGLVSTDGKALYLGESLYRDPAVGFVGQLYAPLHPALIALLNHLHLWNGWAPLLGLTSSLALAGAVGYLGTRDMRLGVPRVLESLGLAALAWWFVSGLQYNMLYSGHSDQVAWAFALLGLLLIPTALRSRRAAVAAILLLTAGFWAKQSTISADLAATAWLIGAAILGRTTWGRALRLGSALLAVNLSILAILNIVTRGWEYYFNFVLAGRRPTSPVPLSEHLRRVVGELERAAMLVIVLAVVLWVAALVARRWRAGSGTTNDMWGYVLLLTVFCIIAFPFAVQSEWVPGSFDNHLIGIVWALTAIMALGWRACRRSGLATSSVAAAAVLAVWASVQHPTLRDALGPDGFGASIPGLQPEPQWYVVPGHLTTLAKQHRVWTPTYGDLNVQTRGEVYMNVGAMGDLLAVGTPSTWMARQFVERRFDYVELPDETARSEGDINPYFHGFGQFEENWIMKLRAVMEAGYKPDPNLPGMLRRRPGPHPSPWMKDCWGPFKLADTSFRIQRGGGFWCQQDGRGDTVTLRKPLAAYSDIRSERHVRRIVGSLDVGIATGGTATVELEQDDGSSARIDIASSGRTVRVTAMGRDAADYAATVPLDAEPGIHTFSIRFVPSDDERVRISNVDGRGVVAEVPSKLRATVLRLGGDDDSSVRYDLEDLRLD